MPSRIRWPNTVPCNLSSHDMCRGALIGQGGTHCLMGWSSVVFKNDRKAELQARDIIRREIVNSSVYNSIICFNDSLEISLSRVANVWNRSMRKLGYTEPAGYWRRA